MGRPSKFSTDQMLDAAAALIARGGREAATIVAIAAALGAPSGSVYHRFSSRDLLIATLWVRTVRRFQAGYREALADPDPTVAAARAIRHVLHWSAENPDDARVLLLHSRESLLAEWPDELGNELVTLNDDVEADLGRFAAAYFGDVSEEHAGRVTLALVGVPYSIVRHAIYASEPIAPWMERAALVAGMSILNEPSDDNLKETT